MGYKKRRNLSREEAEKILEYHEKFEHMIHDMYMNPKWPDMYGHCKRLRVLTYCLYYKFITAEQLKAASLTPGADITTEKVFLNRLTNKGYMEKETTEVPGMKSTLYTITGSGSSYCLDELRRFFKKHGVYTIEEDCLVYMRNRAKSYNSISHSHAIGIRDMNAYLISHLKEPAYRYQLETGIDQTGRVYSLLERAAGNLSRKTDSLQSDALVTIPFHENTQFFYVEQDMNTQRAGVIQNKVRNYIDNVYENHQDEPWRHSIVFAIMSRPTKTTYRTDAQIQTSTHAHYMYSKVISFVIYTLVDYETAFWNVSMTDVYEELLDFCEFSPVSNEFYKNAAAFLKQMLDENGGDLSAEEFIEITRENEKERVKVGGMTDSLIKRHRQAYLARRRTLQHASLQADSVREALLSGFSIYTSHTRWHESTFPYLLPPLFPENEEQLRLLLIFYGYISRNSSCAYSLASSKENGYVLKNRYAYDNGFTLYIENVSDDIGGRIRVERYLQKISWHDGNGLLICLIAPDDVDIARALFMGSNYEKALREPLPVSLPLEVCFLQYDALLRGRDLFSFTADGTYQLKAYPQ